MQHAPADRGHWKQFEMIGVGESMRDDAGVSAGSGKRMKGGIRWVELRIGWHLLRALLEAKGEAMQSN